MSRRYITTAIPYVNSKPHLGFALELVQTDVMARHWRHRGHEVRFLSGTDDNSLKNALAAEEEGVPTQELVDRNAAAFYNLRGPLQISFDDFIRTSGDPRHARGVERLWQAKAASGDLYQKYYEGLYCVGCEQFYSEAELVDGRCPEHLTTPQSVSEENWFFKLSRYEDPLRELIYLTVEGRKLGRSLGNAIDTVTTDTISPRCRTARRSPTREWARSTRQTSSTFSPDRDVRTGQEKV